MMRSTKMKEDIKRGAIPKRTIEIETEVLDVDAV
jgi:hypothetical protein